MGRTAKDLGVGVILDLVALLTAVSVAVAAPGFINFQGRVLDGEGNPLAGPVDIVVAVFDAAIDGAELYHEEHLGTGLVDGVYSILIGQGTSPVGTFDADTFAADGRWLEVVIDGETLTPRQPFASVAYAFQAQIADHAATAGNADTVDGLEGADLDQSAALAAHVGDTANPHSVTAAQVGAATTGALAAHAANSAAHHARYTNGEAVSAVLASDGPGSGLDADRLDGQESAAFASATALATLQATVSSQAAAIIALQNQVTALQELLHHFSRSGNDLFITGANLHIRDGSGNTYGAVNGLGNLIVGYNELRNDGTDDRSGSHNLVVGRGNNYRGYGGFVAGQLNTVAAAYASVSGGERNAATSDYSSVSGGGHNTASASHASVSGGEYNTATGNSSLVAGGYENEAFASWSAILGGWSNWTGDPAVTPTDHNIGTDATISGGRGNIASGLESSVSGGRDNTASGYGASVSGGRHNVASGDYSSVAGGGDESDLGGNEAFAHYSAILGGNANRTGDPAPTPTNHTMGEASSISGGIGNIASGADASVSGGSGNQAFADYSAILGGETNWAGDPATPPTDHSIAARSTISGGHNNKAYGIESTVSGGNSNVASGWLSSVSGGEANTASGERSSVSGGSSNQATAGFSSISGGWGNAASGGNSSVSGGQNNTASGNYSSVGGGNLRSVGGTHDWRAGSCYFCDN